MLFINYYQSVQKPLEYYQNNITGTLTLMDVMRNANVKRIVFSSSATVYGSPEVMPITEDCPKGFKDSCEELERLS